MLNRYYEDELEKLKTLAVEFARANPALAPMLSGRSADPDVERLLEGVAFLTGLARQKLDDEFPEYIQELASLLFPHYLRPVPATTLVMFEPRGVLSETASVPVGAEMASMPIDGTRCIFRTAQALDVHPLTLSAGLVRNVGQTPTLELEFTLRGVDLTRWQSESLRLFLGSGYVEAARLLLLLATEVDSVRLSADEGANAVSVELGARSIVFSGFDYELIPYPSNAFPGYRSLQEFFVQPEKCLFVDLTGLDRLRGCKGNRFTISMALRRLPEWLGEIGNDAFMLNVVPAINLFAHRADPISLDHRQAEYRVLPEGADKTHYQIHSIDRVSSYRQGDDAQREYRPFGLLGYAVDAAQAGADEAVYRTSLRPSPVRRDADEFLSIAYGPQSRPRAETLSIELTCTNRLLPESLRYGDLNQATANSTDRLTFRNIRPITPSLNAPTGEALRWRLLSHTALNFLSIADADNLRALLSLYVFSERQGHGNETANRRRIAGIETMSVARESRMFGRNMLRGQRISLRCRLDHFAGVGDMYVFGCVLDRFLGAYAPINSYTCLELENSFSGEVFKWVPRLGQQPLL